MAVKSGHPVTDARPQREDHIPQRWLGGKSTSMMTLPEAAKALGLAPSTLRHQIKNGKLAARKVSRDWYITAEEVERYRQQNKGD